MNQFRSLDVSETGMLTKKELLSPIFNEWVVEKSSALLNIELYISLLRFCSVTAKRLMKPIQGSTNAVVPESSVRQWSFPQQRF